MAPRRAVVESWRTHGTKVRSIATELATTQAIALLRLAECHIIDGAAVVTPNRVLARGGIVWPTEDEVRRVCRTSKGPGIRRVRLTDEPGQHGVAVEEVG